MGTRVAASTRPLLVGLARSGDLALRTSYIAPAVYCTVKVNGAEVLPVKLASPRYLAVRVKVALLNEVINVPPGAAVPNKTVPL